MLSALALAVCAHAGMDLRFHPLDTTRFALTGAYVPDSDEQAMTLTPGSAKDHRPDLTQAVWELMVSPDGGGPFVRQSGEGHTSETKMLQERAAALLATFPSAPTPRDVGADANLYNADHAANLHTLGFLTRMPHRLNLVSQVIAPALRGDTGQRLDAFTRYQRVAVCHDGRAQRWLVVSAEAAWQRAEVSVNRARQRAAEASAQPRLHGHAKRLETPDAAKAALAPLALSWPYHPVDAGTLRDHKR